MPECSERNLSSEVFTYERKSGETCMNRNTALVAVLNP